MEKKKKFNTKFLEYISEIIYKDPKLVRILNENRNRFGFVHYDKQQSDTVVLVDAMGYQIYLDISENKTKIRIQPIILTRNGWIEIEEPHEGVLTDKDHFLFKPLPAIIKKAHENELKKALVKIEEKFLKKQTCDVDPLLILYKEIKEEAIRQNETQEGSNKVTAFGSGNPELMDFNDWTEKDEEK